MAMIELHQAPYARRASVTLGATLNFETLSKGPAPLRRRAREDTLLRVIDGTVALSTSSGVELLETGGEAIIPAGTGHRLSSRSSRARVVIGFRS